jgi:hypothetical protein
MVHGFKGANISKSADSICFVETARRRRRSIPAALEKHGGNRGNVHTGRIGRYWGSAGHWGERLRKPVWFAVTYEVI